MDPIYLLANQIFRFFTVDTEYPNKKPGWSGQKV